MDYRLGNAEEHAARSPRSFFIPSRAEREHLQPGDGARLLFELVDPPEGGPLAERMWVRVQSAQDGRYVGRLDDAPAEITSIRAGELLEFGPEHVITTMSGDPRLRLHAYVSRRSHERDLRPQLVSRDESLDDTDSGWCVFVGDETDEELDDPRNFLLQPLGFLLDRWPELDPVFARGEVGSEWEWDAATSSYQQV